VPLLALAAGAGLASGAAAATAEVLAAGMSALKGSVLAAWVSACSKLAINEMLSWLSSDECPPAPPPPPACRCDPLAGPTTEEGRMGREAEMGSIDIISSVLEIAVLDISAPKVESLAPRQASGTNPAQYLRQGRMGRHPLEDSRAAGLLNAIFEPSVAQTATHGRYCGSMRQFIAARSRVHRFMCRPHRNAFIKEFRMSSILGLSSASAAFPPLNIHPHGHKHGSHVGSLDDSGSDTAAQVPAGAAKNLFGTLLQSLEQVIGVQSSTAAATATAATATSAATAATAATAASGIAAAGSTAAASTSAAAASTQTASTLLQNYLNNLAHTLQANGSPTPKFAGSNVSISA
jgi:hypothetical protein